MVRKSDGSLRRPGPVADYWRFYSENDGDLVIEHDDAIHEVGPYLMGSIDFDPAVMLSYEASLLALDDRLLLRVIQREDSWERDKSLRISEDGGRTWQALTEAPPLDAWRLVDHVEA